MDSYLQPILSKFLDGDWSSTKRPIHLVFNINQGSFLENELKTSFELNLFPVPRRINEKDGVYHLVFTQADDMAIAKQEVAEAPVPWRVMGG